MLARVEKRRCSSALWPYAAASAPATSAQIEGLRAGGSVRGGGDVLAAERKEVVDLIMGREEPLCLAGGLEPLHLPFASPCRLVRILRPVVQTFVPAVLDAWHQ